MKKLFIFVFVLCLFLPSFAQEEPETLFGNRSLSFSGYGGPSLRYFQLDGKSALMTGGFGAVLINNQWGFGGGGYGLVSKIQAPDDVKTTDGKPMYAQFGYGGFYMDYTHTPNKLVHLNYGLFIGAGGIDYSEKFYSDFDEDDAGTAFFVAEPSVNLEMNVTNFFHPSIGVSYRFVNGIDGPGFTDKDFSQVNLTLNFKFGWFGRSVTVD